MCFKVTNLLPPESLSSLSNLGMLCCFDVAHENARRLALTHSEMSFNPQSSTGVLVQLNFFYAVDARRLQVHTENSSIYVGQSIICIRSSSWLLMMILKCAAGQVVFFCFTFFVVTDGAGAVSSTPSTNIWNKKKRKTDEKTVSWKIYSRFYGEDPLICILKHIFAVCIDELVKSIDCASALVDAGGLRRRLTKSFRKSDKLRLAQ